jgi:LysR family transcriptional regulator, hypochlorite-specific transcription factor HypT
MNTEWIEDFITLVQTKSFSKAAKLRNCNQSSFSRRIQNLEAWAGNYLIDRSTASTSLTDCGQLLYEHGIQILANINQARTLLRHNEQNMLEFAIPYSLALNFFPKWLYKIQAVFGLIKCKLNSIHMHDAVMLMNDASCDFLMLYQHPSQPIELNLNQYESKIIGQEKFAPYSSTDWDKSPMHDLYSSKVPFLSYNSNVYLGRLSQYLIKKHELNNLETCYETDTAESLKSMAIEGHGIAFLPQSSVLKELDSGLLVRADICNKSNKQLISLDMDICIYKHIHRFSLHHTPQDSAREQIKSQIWQHI